MARQKLYITSPWQSLNWDKKLYSNFALTLKWAYSAKKKGLFSKKKKNWLKLFRFNPSDKKERRISD